MLVKSGRHSDQDRTLWFELEEADLVHAETKAMRARELQATDAIEQFVAAGQPCYAGVSWGKDSVVVAHLLWRVARGVPLVHLRPTNHNPDCDLVRDAYFAGFPGQPYEEVLVDYGGIDRISLPHQEVDRQTDQRWYAAIRQCEKVYGGRHILGIRAGESMGRRFRMMRWGLNSKNASAPIGRWTTQDVFAYLATYRLPVHPAYGCLGGGRWPRERLRVAEIGDTHGTGSGRREWEQEHYGDVLRRLETS